MPYEIPQNLKYTEKIFFGLTFIQAFWLGLFGGIAGVIFFKAPFDLVVKAFLVVVLLGLGIGFAFLKFFDYLIAYKAFSSGVREAGFFDKRLNNFVEVKKIENDSIFLQNGSLRAILEVVPINFAILSEPEQRAVISAYKDFLNSLDFSIQIVMRTTSLNLDDYLFSLRKEVLKQTNPELEKQFDSFKEFVQNFISQNSVKNRLFYVVVPFSPYSRSQPLKDTLTMLKNLFSKNKTKTVFELNKEIALNQLNVRVELCKEKLKKCGLLSERLDDKKLFSLLTSFFDSFLPANSEYFFPITLLEKFSESGVNE